MMLIFYLRILGVYTFIKLPLMLNDCFTYDYSKGRGTEVILAVAKTSEPHFNSVQPNTVI